MKGPDRCALGSKVQCVANERPLGVAQWQILRHLLGRPWAQQELATALGRRSQAVAKSLGVLQERGMIMPVDKRTHSGPKTPARRWTLTELGRMFADGAPPVPPAPHGEQPQRVTRGPEDDDDESGDTGASQPETFGLARHQGFLVATVEGSRVPVLLEALADAEQGVEAGFVARLDGDAHGYYFFFDPRLGARPAETLGAALRASDIDVALGVVADVRGLDTLLRDARAARAGALRASQRAPRDESSE